MRLNEYYMYKIMSLVNLSIISLVQLPGYFFLDLLIILLFILKKIYKLHRHYKNWEKSGKF